MGKKTKIGKDRKDKFYKLAKETGFRSRAAFKLIQLNRKFGFLQQSQVCIDLCAAPGGWMQVAKQNMPVSSIVIGVDLYPIRAIPGCIALIEDITTDKCRTAITKELQSWKADVILNDGAPNVGKNWLFDAYQQICLTLSALKLSTEFLKKGGWFITKVFRSKDYNALMWVLKQLFRKVHATKPSASRKESAEIFVVCQYFIAPDKIDEKLLNAKYVFEELDLDKDKEISLLHPDKKRIKAEGYSEKDFALRNELKVSEFIKNVNGLSALQGVSEIIFDDDKIKEHRRTTAELRECCRDIKVLGRKDIRLLIAWWKHLHNEFYPKLDKNEKKDGDQDADDDDADQLKNKKKLTQEEVDEMEFNELEKHISDLAVEDAKDLKRKRKRVQQTRQKLNEKLNLKMVIKGDAGPQEEDNEVFSLSQIGTMEELERLQDQQPDLVLNDGKNRNDEFKAKYKRYDKDEQHLDDDGKYKSIVQRDSDLKDDASSGDESEDLNKTGLGLSDSDSDKDSADDQDADDDQDEEHHLGRQKKIPKSKKGKINEQQHHHPLITDLDHRDKDTKRKQRVQLWFEKDNLKNINADDAMDEDLDLDKLTAQYKYKGVNVIEKKSNEVMASTTTTASARKSNEPKMSALPLGKKAKRRAKYTNDEDNKNESSSSSSDSDTDTESNRSAGGNNDNDDEFKIVPQKEKPKKFILNEQELALGAMMVQSKKIKRDLIDAAWNRYAFNDREDLPDWFKQDEAVHMRKEVPVTKELAEEYRQKVEELNVRPMKKVMEAKARKKRRALKRLDKAKKKAEGILENADSSAQEKMRQIKKLYKKAHEEKKNEVSYVVTRKYLASKRVRRPAGVKGRFKVVDPRMKKDKRAAASKEKTKNRRKQR